MEKPNIITKILIGIGAIFMLMGIYYAFTLIQSNRLTYTLGDSKEQPFEIINLKNDTIFLLKQQIAFYETRSPLVKDSLIDRILTQTKIKPTAVIQWKTIVEGRQKNIQLEDSLQGAITGLLLSQDQLMKLNDSERKKYNADKDALLSKRIKFIDSSKYYKIEGDYGINDKINLTKELYSEPFVILGDKTPILGLGKTKYSVLLGDKNPDVRILSAQNSFYSPPAKWEIGFGPSILFNQKSITTGLSVTAKKGIFAGSLGYTVDHRQFK